MVGYILEGRRAFRGHLGSVRYDAKSGLEVNVSSCRYGEGRDLVSKDKNGGACGREDDRR